MKMVKNVCDKCFHAVDRFKDSNINYSIIQYKINVLIIHDIDTGIGCWCTPYGKGTSDCFKIVGP